MRRHALILALALVGPACDSDDDPATDTLTDTTADTLADTTAELPDTSDPGSDSVSTTVNGCDPATATDSRNTALVAIAFGNGLGNTYSPACVRVTAGTQVQFNGDFGFHPFAPGTVIGLNTMYDASSPLVTIGFGNNSATLSQTGTYPYYCTAHYAEGMMGAIYVE